MDDSFEIPSDCILLFCFTEYIAVMAGMQQDWVNELKAVGLSTVTQSLSWGGGRCQTLLLKNYYGTAAGESFCTVTNVSVSVLHCSEECGDTLRQYT